MAADRNKSHRGKTARIATKPVDTPASESTQRQRLSTASLFDGVRYAPSLSKMANPQETPTPLFVVRVSARRRKPRRHHFAPSPLRACTTSRLHHCLVSTERQRLTRHDDDGARHNVRARVAGTSDHRTHFGSRCTSSEGVRFLHRRCAVTRCSCGYVTEMALGCVSTSVASWKSGRSGSIERMTP